MRSIRQSLATWLMLWISLLWVISGVGVFAVLNKNLEDSLDRNLDALADKARLIVTSRDGVQLRFSPIGFAFPTTNPAIPLFEPGSNFFYQAWDANSGQMVGQSNNLSAGRLPWQTSENAERWFWNDRLHGVGAIRCIGLQLHRRASGGREALTLNLVIANDRAFVDGRLGLLVMTLLITSLCGAVTTWIVVRSVVKRGLSPLSELGDQLSAVDPHDLRLRWLAGELPVELQPVSRALNKMVGRIDEGFERERRFSGDVAHEFRTAIAELRALAEVAIRWPHRASADDYQAVLSISVQMEEIIEILLELTRVESGSVSKELSPVLLRTEILKCWQPFSERALAKRIVLVCDMADSLEIKANAVMLNLIVKNLLENAVEYSEAGGQVVVSFKLEADQIGWLVFENMAVNLQLSDVDHLFERFWRGDDSRTGGRHSGLGLSLSSSCAHAMGMDLVVSLTDAREFAIRLGRITVC